MLEATTAVDEPDATIVTEFVYDETNSEKKSWKFCNNVTLPRSESSFCCANGSNSNFTNFLHSQTFFH